MTRQHTADDIAEHIATAISRHANGSFDPHVFLTNGEQPPVVVIRPEGTGQMWFLAVKGPVIGETPDDIAQASGIPWMKPDGRPVECRTGLCEHAEHHGR